LKGAEFADALICFSTRSAHVARLTHPKVSVHLLPHYFECPQSENLFLKRENGPLVVSTAARLVARKGVEDFIQMAGRLKSVYPSASFLIAGAGEQETQLRQLNAELGNPAEFIGWQSVSDLAGRTDVYCLTSRVESFWICSLRNDGARRSMRRFSLQWAVANRWEQSSSVDV
jgi:glycosyltransferase involved in cell wall biosynthesis